jgi:DNA mismatch endonuclease (patch repair protein)
MQANRSRDTRPELAVRRILHARGRRFRVAVAPLEGLRRRADIVFTRQQIAVFIDGCFWHGCPVHGRASFNHNTDYWPGKIAGNQARDRETTRLLQEAGWHVLRFWEHESADVAASSIEAALESAITNSITERQVRALRSRG